MSIWRFQRQLLILQALAAINNKNIHYHFVGHAMDENCLNELATLVHDMAVTEQETFHRFIANLAFYLYHFNALATATYYETFG